MIKKGTAVCIAALITIFTAAGAYAQTPVDLKINDKIINTTAQPFIVNWNTLVPLRQTAEALGCSVKWEQATKTAKISDGKNNIEFPVGKAYAMVNGNKKTMPTNSRLQNGITYVGVRFLSDNLGIEISWNEKTHTAELKKTGHHIKQEYIEDDYTPDDLDWLAKIVHAEAGGEIHDGKVAVANVVINRTNSREFPNNIYDVVFDKKHGVQFTPVANGAIYNNPSKESYHAAKQALFGKSTAGESLYFCNPKISTNFWIMNNRKFFASIGNHNFYL